MDDYTKKLEKEIFELKNEIDKLRSRSHKNNKQRKGFIKFVGLTFAGRRLKKSFYRVLNQYSTEKFVTRDAISDLLASIVYRFTRIGLFTLIFALLPFILLIQQNILLKQQNKKIQDQNYLAEASRRSAQMFIMGDVLSDINAERRLSNQLSSTLTGRIASLSRAMKPYKYFENGQLIKHPRSPERGQLLLTITKSDIKHSQLSDQIFQLSDFTYSELSGVIFQNAYLKDINLAHSDLSHANMVNTNLTDASFIYADLNSTDFSFSNLRFANFSNSNLTNANLQNTNLSGADFSNAVLDSVIIHRKDWLKYIKDDLKLKGAEQLYDAYVIDSVYDKHQNKKVTMLLKK